MDIFAVIVLGALCLAVLALIALGLFSPRRASEITDKDRHRRWMTQAEIEGSDVPQMVEGQNAYRRARGETEMTEDDAQREAALAQRESIARAKRAAKRTGKARA
jgi:hypothetical protein